MSRVHMTVLGLLMALLIVSLDQTILVTALPVIVAKLGGMKEFAWVFSAYLIASVAGMPLFGKLSDMYGRKRFFVFGIIVFMAGSMLCGTASSMDGLIMFRVVQGIGGGALMPVVFTILFDLFPADKRAKMTGLFGAVFGLSSVLGPIAGGFFTDYMHWRWIFFINLPIGLIALLIVVFCYRETLVFRKQQLDWLGTFTLVASILCFMFALEMGGKEEAWTSPLILGLFAATIALLIAFIWIESRVAEPIIPLRLFHNRLFTSSMAAGLLFGMVLMAGAVFIPLFVQGVAGGSATSASTVLTPMMLALVVSSMAGGMLVRQLPFRNIMLIAVSVLLAAVVCLAGVTPETSQLQMTLYMIVMGLGIGASYPVTSLAAQHNIDYRQRGTVNSLVRFFQTLGNALGIAIFGSFQTSCLQEKYSAVLSDPKLAEAFGNPQVLLQEEVRQSMPGSLLKQLLEVLSDSIAYVFQWSILICLFAVMFILMMGRVKMVTTKPHGHSTTAAVQASASSGER